MTSQYLPSVEMHPPRTARAAVIWLHGLGADGHDFESVVPYLGLGDDHAVRFVFPHAPRIPVTINGGMVMPAWYDILEMDLERRADLAGVQRSAAQVVKLLDREGERGIPPEHVVVAGFSQGGAVALYLGPRHPQRLAGVMALSTYLVSADTLPTERSEANRETPFFMAHGEVDPMVPFTAGKAARDVLHGMDYEVEWHAYPMAHQVCLEELEAIGGWLRRVLPPDSLGRNLSAQGA